MDVNALEQKLCKNVRETEEREEEFRVVEKVLAPFLRTLKKRKKSKADILPEYFKDLYLKKNPRELIEQFATSYTDPVKFKTLFNESAELLKVVTNSKSVNLYLVDYIRNEILLCPKHVLHNERFERKYAIDSGTYVAAHVAYTKEHVVTTDILGDNRFPLGIPLAGTSVRSVICLPIITNVNDNCIGVIELYRDNEEPYTLADIQICNALTAWMGIAIEQNNGKMLLIKEMEIQKRLSVLAEMYFSGIIPFSKIIADILSLSKTAVNAERGEFYVFHEAIQKNSQEVLFADAYEEVFIEENSSTVLFKRRNKARFAKNEPGVAGYAARSGEIINIHDAYKDHRFDRKGEHHTFRTRSIMAVPVKNEHGVLAVMVLMNCIDYPYFRKEDTEIIQSFLHCVALICGYFLLEVAFNKVQLKLVVTDKLLDYHTKSMPEDALAVKNFFQDSQVSSGFYRFDWDLSTLEDDPVKYIFAAFYTSDIMEPCFDFQHLCDFLLRVKKSYRPVIYHNFEHAFSVFHCVYNMIAKCLGVFTQVEVVTLLLAALCHDIDHMGYTNSFISLKNDSTFKLYGDFCGEAHRFEFTAFLIQATNLLSNITAQNCQIILKNLKRLMLAFDLAIHFQNRRKITKLINSNTFVWDNTDHRHLLQNMLLIAADYNMNYKGFESVKKNTSNFYKELYKQGDLEKSMGFTPLPVMDRTKMDLLPENQIIFISVICLPCVEIVVSLLPQLEVLFVLLKKTLSKWNEKISLRGQQLWKAHHAVPKEKKERRSQRLTLSSTMSSIRTMVSESKS